MTKIRLEAVTRTFGPIRAVDDISIAIADGEFFTLLGPSGCGKTTLLRMIAGFCDIERGSISFDDKRVDTLPAHQRNIGMVFQNYAIFPNLTVEGNVAYGLRARSVPRHEIPARMAKALQMVRLAGYGARWPHELSGGQLQRVAIARSLAIEPAVLLFDEPLSNLDAQLRAQMRLEIRELQKSLNVTTVYVTHDQEEALAVSDRIAVLRAGRIEQVGSPEEIYRAPQTAFVAEFLGTTNLLLGHVGTFDGACTKIAAGGTEIMVAGYVSAPGERVQISIRPEALHVVRVGDDGKNPRLTVHLQMREFLGPVQRLHAVLPDGTPLYIAALGSQAIQPTGDGELILAYDPAQLMTFAVS